jgi:hypothetical protein
LSVEGNRGQSGRPRRRASIKDIGVLAGFSAAATLTGGCLRVEPAEVCEQCVIKGLSGQRRPVGKELKRTQDRGGGSL